MHSSVLICFRIPATYRPLTPRGDSHLICFGVFSRAVHILCIKGLSTKDAILDSICVIFASFCYIPHSFLCEQTQCRTGFRQWHYSRDGLLLLQYMWEIGAPNMETLVYNIVVLFEGKEQHLWFILSQILLFIWNNVCFWNVSL